MYQQRHNACEADQGLQDRFDQAARVLPVLAPGGKPQEGVVLSLLNALSSLVEAEVQQWLMVTFDFAQGIWRASDQAECTYLQDGDSHAPASPACPDGCPAPMAC